jgi:hypothetical protein
VNQVVLNSAQKVHPLPLSEELTIIPAFVATLPQAAVLALAANPNVRYISPDGPVQVISGRPAKGSKPAPNPRPPKSAPHSKHGFDAANLVTTYPIDTGASSAWSASDGHVETGSGVSVAIIDSGIDAAGRQVARSIDPRGRDPVACSERRPFSPNEASRNWMGWPAIRPCPDTQDHSSAATRRSSIR